MYTRTWTRSIINGVFRIVSKGLFLNSTFYGVDENCIHFVLRLGYYLNWILDMVFCFRLGSYSFTSFGITTG